MTMVDVEQSWRQQARRATFEDYRRRHVSTWIEPRGTSMRPLIGPHTWMQVEFGATQVATGDIVVFSLGDTLVAHRVVAQKMREGGLALVPKGDAEPYSDQLLKPADVLGVVRALRRNRQGPSTRFGCAGRSARAIAAVSRIIGHGAGLLRGLAATLPDPPRQKAINAIAPFTRVVARILLTPLSWAAWNK